MTSVGYDPTRRGHATSHEAALEGFRASLPRGVVVSSVPYQGTSPFGVFRGPVADSAEKAAESVLLLTAAERAALVLGAPSQEHAERFRCGDGCLQHSARAVQAFLEQLQVLCREFGAMELHLDPTSPRAQSLRPAETIADFVRLADELGAPESSLVGALIARAACIDPADSTEWPTIEVAAAARVA